MRLKNYFPVLFSLAVFAAGCKKSATEPVTHSNNSISFKLEKTFNTEDMTADVALQVNGDQITGTLNSLDADLSTLALSFSSNGATVRVKNVVQKSGISANDFSKPVIYNVTWPDGTSKDYTVTINKYSGLPIFYLTTDAPVTSKDTYVNGTLDIDANNQYPQEQTSIGLQIKGRGNSTWGMPKKPYRLKFKSKAAVLGLPSAKNWVLLANYSDKSLMRNALAFEMGKLFSADFTPTGRFVDVVMNGKYIGNYYLTEQVEVDKDRINITDMKASDISGDKLTGGYLLELDKRLDADYYFYTGKGLPFTINTPEDITPEQLTYIHEYVQHTEDAIFSANFNDPVNGYSKYINVDSFINWYLVNELMENNDAEDFSSIYYYKDRNGKLGMGPVWDFDIAGGNVDFSDCQRPTGWWISHSVWFSRLFQDPAFKQKVIDRWSQLKVYAIPQLFKFIAQNRAYLKLSADHNFTTWNILNTYVWPNAVVLGSYDSEVQYLNNWLQQRVNWMDSQYSLGASNFNPW